MRREFKKPTSCPLLDDALKMALTANHMPGLYRTRIASTNHVVPVGALNHAQRSEQVAVKTMKRRQKIITP